MTTGNVAPDINIGDFAFLNAAHEIAEWHRRLLRTAALSLEQAEEHRQQKPDDDDERDVFNETVQSDGLSGDDSGDCRLCRNAP